jgi:peptide/nickel transport system substrate-binding protein
MIIKPRKGGIAMTKITKNIILSVSALVIGILLMTGPSLAADIKRGGTITVGIDTGPVGWDPHIDIAFSTWNHCEQLYESLVRFNHKMEIVPSLATSWEQPDKLTFIFKLRKGVKFHNGREMIADDVKYSFERMKNPKTSARPIYTEPIKSIEVLDKYTVKMTMSIPYPTFLPFLAYMRFSAIVPREVVEKHGDLKSVTCGTGPFKVKEYVPGDYTVFEPHKEYWDKGLPRVDELIFKVIKDPTSRLAALRKRSLDVGWVKEAQLANQASKTKGLRIVAPPPARQMRVWLNHSSFPFNNKKLRQAFAASIDREAMIKTVLMGFGEITSCIPPSSVPYALSKEEVAKLPFYRRDVNLAKKLLKEAGYPDGFEFTHVSSDHSPDYMSGSQMMQSSLKDVGITMKIQQVEWGIHLNRWKSGDFQSLQMGGVWETDPDYYIRPFFHSKSKSNYGSYKNPEIDKLLDESRVTMDVKKRIEIWKKIQYIMAEDIPILWPEAGPPRFEIVQDYVKDYYFMSDISRSYLRQAWLDK